MTDDDRSDGGRSTAGAILDVLGSAGVTTAHGLPGVHNLPFWAAADGRPGRPRLVNVRHEQTTVYAADGLARATGGLGVALTTTGPGAANAVAAFGEAAASGSPVVLVASEVATGQRLADGSPRGALHDLADQGALFAPLAKAVYRAATPVAAVEAVARAAAHAMTHPRGPVYVGVPADVLAAPLPTTVAGLPVVAPAPAPAPTPRDVDVALAALQASDRPLLWVGGGVVESGAEGAVVELAARLGAPVVTTYAARGLLGPGHPLGVTAPPHEPEVADLVASADLLVGLGTAFDAMTTRGWAMPRPPRLLAVNVDADDLVRGLAADVAVRCDVGALCDAVAVRLRAREPWADSVFRLGPAVRRRVAADPRTASAAALLEAVEAGWPDDGDVLCDMAVAGYWVGGYAATARTRRIQYPVGWGTLGYALPASVGAAAGGRPVLVVCGDGGAAMAVGELATLRQEGLPVVVLVVDDGGYGMLRYDQRVAGEPERGVDLDGPDWPALAAAYHLDAVEVPGPESLGAALAEAYASVRERGPRLLHLPLALFPPRTTSPRWHEDAPPGGPVG
jgi:acetolactate synthase-1/2/3 large subunit